MDNLHDAFGPGFFTRVDESLDHNFYVSERFVTHIDDRAIAAVGSFYEQLGITGSVLDLCSSWISHFHRPPRELVALGMNGAELAANPMATDQVIQDLNTTTALPFPNARFDAVTCCVSIDYLVRPIDVLVECARVLRPGGHLAITFSNRCFPTKAIQGWLATGDEDHCNIVAAYIRLTDQFTPPAVLLCTPPGTRGDPLFGVWATRLAPPADTPVAHE
jgi:SAM-dependent methyltransferase